MSYILAGSAAQFEQHVDDLSSDNYSGLHLKKGGGGLRRAGPNTQEQLYSGPG